MVIPGSLVRRHLRSVSWWRVHWKLSLGMLAMTVCCVSGCNRSEHRHPAVSAAGAVASGKAATAPKTEDARALCLSSIGYVDSCFSAGLAPGQPSREQRLQACLTNRMSVEQRRFDTVRCISDSQGDCQQLKDCVQQALKADIDQRVGQWNNEGIVHPRVE